MPATRKHAPPSYLEQKQRLMAKRESMHNDRIHGQKSGSVSSTGTVGRERQNPWSNGRLADRKQHRDGIDFARGDRFQCQIHRRPGCASVDHIPQRDRPADGV
jgi:hypothetical protein